MEAYDRQMHKSSELLWQAVVRIIKACFKSFCHLEFITSRIFEVEAKFKLFRNVYQKENININRKFQTPGNFGCPKGVEIKLNFSPKRATTLTISDMKP